MLVQLYDSCDAYGSLYFNDAANRRRSKREHDTLLEAARAHDAERVVELLAAHRQHVVDALRGPLAAADESGTPLDATPPRRRRRAVAGEAAG
jgi:DNA-binding GntR family transcriptional regulator